MKKRYLSLIVGVMLMIALAGCQSGWTPKAAVASCQAKVANQSSIGIPASEYNALLAIDKAAGVSIIPARTGVWPCRYTSPPCQWDGVTCMFGHVTQLILPNQNLGYLPPEVGQLTELSFLDLSDNQLSRLPPDIGQLVHLQKLYDFVGEVMRQPETQGRQRAKSICQQDVLRA
ncbi:MAG: hypothetical protein JXJ17_18280, partial [Anaerolineae bacterium]|nr:hypothetical protein [Anaerolineae bacterium]